MWCLVPVCVETCEPSSSALTRDRRRDPAAGQNGAGVVFRRPRSLIVLIYIIIGIIIAFSRSYITLWLLKGILSALLAIFLWWLPLLGVNLHIH
jgi:hypothetical protein